MFACHTAEFWKKTFYVLTLAIETSQPAGSIALLRNAECLAERTLQLRQGHGQSLIPGLAQLLRDFGYTPRDCGRVAVGTGPGSFTGLRVGIVCAKTWAYATGAQLVDVPSFLTIASNAPPDVAELQVVSDAQRGDFSVGRFRRDPDGNWLTVGTVEILAAAEWRSSLQPGQVIATPQPAVIAPWIAEHSRLLPIEMGQPSARWTGWWGDRRADEGQFADPWSLEPLYLRRSSAEETWDARTRTRKLRPETTDTLPPPQGLF